MEVSFTTSSQSLSFIIKVRDFFTNLIYLLQEVHPEMQALGSVLETYAIFLTLHDFSPLTHNDYEGEQVNLNEADCLIK